MVSPRTPQETFTQLAYMVRLLISILVPDLIFITDRQHLECFLTKFGPQGNFIWARTWGSYGDENATALAVDGNSNTYSGGRFQGTVDFDPGPGVEERTAVGTSDAFLVSFDSTEISDGFKPGKALPMILTPTAAEKSGLRVVLDSSTMLTRYNTFGNIVGSMTFNS